MPTAPFMTHLQRLLLEGEYVGTYKYALLISLARWAVENPGWDDGQELDVGELAPHFLELYWPHVQPFVVGGEVREGGVGYAGEVDSVLRGVLLQDRGQREERQTPRVLKEIARAQREHGGALHRLPVGARDGLLKTARKTIRDMPLWKLQSLRSSREPVEVLYGQGSNGYQIRFAPGVPAALTHFAPLVEELARSAWLRHVIRSNPGLLGAPSQVESFLFPGARNGLAALRAPLLEVQGDVCFYCRKALGSTTAVDHFLPWVRYRRDLGHNFVLTHAACNSAKSDVLAAPVHLERWVQRNLEHGAFLAERFEEKSIPYDLALTHRVAVSLYGLAEAEGADLWVEKGEWVAVEPGWRGVLGVVAR